MAFPTWVDVTESSETGFTPTHVYDLPATVDPNDRLILSAAGGHDSFGPAGGTLAGWDLVYALTLNGFYRWEIWTKIAAGDEDGGTVAFTTSNAVRSSAQVVRIAASHLGGDGVGWEVSAGSGLNYGTTPNPDSVTAPWGSADNLFLALATCGSNGTTVTGNPTDYTGGADGDAAAQYVVASAYRAIAADTQDPAAFTIGTGENWAAVTLVVRPSSGAEGFPARADARTRVTSAPFASVPVAVTPARAEARAAARPVVGFPFTPEGPRFPASTLTVRLEVAWGANLDNPGSWVWTDLTDRLVGDLSDLAIGLTSGRAPESSDTQPSSLDLTLDNWDGALTPGNPMSPWWPNVERGAPIRVWVESGTPALYMPGVTGSECYTPDHPDLAVTDLDVRVLVDPDRWAYKALFNSSQLQSGVNTQRLIGRDLAGTGGDYGWLLSTFDVGRPAFEWSNTGSGATLREADRTVASLRPSWIAGTFDVDNGAGGHTIRLYRWTTPGNPPTDIGEWELVQEWTAPGIATLHHPTGAPLVLGIRGVGAPASFRGRILKAEMRDGINGAVIANPDFTAAPVGAPVLFDGTGKPWILTGAARVTREQIRFTGQLAELSIDWPIGDHYAGVDVDDPAGRQPSESRAQITAAGPLRRLSQGAQPLRSPLYRGITGATALDNIVAYWPMEDENRAAVFASGLAGGTPLEFTGWKPAANSNQVASAPLPTTAKTGDPVTWAAPVTDCPTTRWAVEWFSYLETPEASPAVTELLAVQTTGSVTSLRVTINDAEMKAAAFAGATNVGNLTLSGNLFSDKWLLLRLELQQAGANLDWRFGYVDIGTGGGLILSGTIPAQTMGPIVNVSGTTVGPPDGGLTMGHLIVQDGTLATGWLSKVDTAWAGESAAHRFWRLCAEEGIPVEIIGDPTAYRDGRGDLTRSQAMGPQGRDTLLDLLAECVTCDMGALIERRRVPGLIYRTRQAVEDQDAQLALDAGNEEVRGPLTPIVDDARLRNDLTVTSAGGSSARAVDPVSVARSGLYDDAVTIGGVGGVAIQSSVLVTQPGLVDAVANQNAEQAAWRLELAGASTIRYSTLVVDLGIAPHLIDTWLGTQIGDRVTVAGLPAQHPGDVIELIVDEMDETMTPTGWIVKLGCAPGDGWLTGELAP